MSLSRSMMRAFAPVGRTAQAKFVPARSSITPLFRRAYARPAEQPRLRLGSEAPNFQAKTTHGDIDFHNHISGSWAILFSHPADFTPVCTTELGAFSKLKDEFDRRGVKMIGLSANDLKSHDKWIEDINDIAKTNLQFPIIADADREVAFLYDMVDQQDLTNIDEKGIAFTIRSVFVIDPAKVSAPASLFWSKACSGGLGQPQNELPGVRLRPPTQAWYKFTDFSFRKFGSR